MVHLLYFFASTMSLVRFPPDSKLEDYPVRPVRGSAKLTKEDIEQLSQLDFLRESEFTYDAPYDGTVAIAPVRSRPLRTYEPSSISLDSEGRYVPSYLADLVYRDDMVWPVVKERLESFGVRSGLFDKFEVVRHGSDLSSSFQLRIGKCDGNREVLFRNLVDVGYGISQALPVIVELLRPNGAAQLLLQQPEVHLHPSAQAELGSLFCEIAAQGRQLIVETHSDHLIDRVRMDVRDGKSDLKPEDVRILYFERDGLDVKIHEIWYDDMGNLQNVPDGYRRFFMEEVEIAPFGDSQ